MYRIALRWGGAKIFSDVQADAAAGLALDDLDALEDVLPKGLDVGEDVYKRQDSNSTFGKAEVIRSITL